MLQLCCINYTFYLTPMDLTLWDTPNKKFTALTFTSKNKHANTFNTDIVFMIYRYFYMFNVHPYNCEDTYPLPLFIIKKVPTSVDSNHHTWRSASVQFWRWTLLSVSSRHTSWFTGLISTYEPDTKWQK